MVELANKSRNKLLIKSLSIMYQICSHYLSLCLFVSLSLCLFVSLSLSHFVSLSLFLFVCFSVCVFLCLPFCLFVTLSVCLFVFLSLFLFVAFSYSTRVDRVFSLLFSRHQGNTDTVLRGDEG